MSDPTSDEVRVLERAERARSDLVATEDAFDAIRKETLEALAATKLGESELREKLYMSVQVLDAVRERLISEASAAAMVDHSRSMRQLLEGLDEGAA